MEYQVINTKMHSLYNNQIGSFDYNLEIHFCNINGFAVETIKFKENEMETIISNFIARFGYDFSEYAYNNKYVIIKDGVPYPLDFGSMEIEPRFKGNYIPDTSPIFVEQQFSRLVTIEQMKTFYWLVILKSLYMNTESGFESYKADLRMGL